MSFAHVTRMAIFAVHNVATYVISRCPMLTQKPSPRPASVSVRAVPVATDAAVGPRLADATAVSSVLAVIAAWFL